MGFYPGLCCRKHGPGTKAQASRWLCAGLGTGLWARAGGARRGSQDAREPGAGAAVAVDWTPALHSDSSPGASAVAAGRPPFSAFLLLFPTPCFLRPWPQLIPALRNRPRGLLVRLDGHRGATSRRVSLEGGESALSEKSASDIRSHGGGGRGSWDAQGRSRESSCQGLPRDQKVTEDTRRSLRTTRTAAVPGSRFP